MGKIVACYVPKGGVGKSFLATHISAGLGMAGKRVLLIDADVDQCQTAITFGNLEPRGDVKELVLGDAPISQLTQQTAEVPGLHVITGSQDSSNEVIRALVYEPKLKRRLRDRLQEAAQRFDYVIFDCAPAKSTLTEAILLSCDEIWVPVAPEWKNVHSIILLRDRILPELGLSANLIKFGIPNGINYGAERKSLLSVVENTLAPLLPEWLRRARTNQAIKILAEAQRLLGDRLTPPIRYSEAFAQQSDEVGVTVWQLADRDLIADDLFRVVEHILVNG